LTAAAPDDEEAGADTGAAVAAVAVAVAAATAAGDTPPPALPGRGVALRASARGRDAGRDGAASKARLAAIRAGGRHAAASGRG